MCVCLCVYISIYSVYLRRLSNIRSLNLSASIFIFWHDMDKAAFFKLSVGFVYLNEIFVAHHSITQNCCRVIELMLLVLFFFWEKGIFQRIW